MAELDGGDQHRCQGHCKEENNAGDGRDTGIQAGIMRTEVVFNGNNINA